MTAEQPRHETFLARYPRKIKIAVVVVVLAVAAAVITAVAAAIAAPAHASRVLIVSHWSFFTSM